MPKRARVSRRRRPKGETQRRVVVKFHDFVELRYVDHAEEQIQRLKLAPWEGLARRFPGITLTRMFTAIQPARIQSLVVEATRLDPSYRPPNFLTYFVVYVPPRLDPEALAAAFRDWRIVQTAYVDPLDGPAVEPAAPVDPGMASQGYLGPGWNPVDPLDPKYGVDALFAWKPPLLGGAGEGQKLIDMERAFVIGHPDLPPFTKLFGQYQVGFPQSPPSHGAGMLGVSCMVDNAVGGVGIAFRVGEVNVVSHWLGGADTNIDRPGAIFAAINHFSQPGQHAFGRVLLIPLHIVPPGVTDFSGTAWVYMPIETVLAEFDAIRLATALGIVVVEVAGNGGEYNGNLDNFREAVTGNYVLNTAGPGFRDSGAIMIGSANSPLAPGDASIPQPAVVRARRYTSNYGSRLNCFAWGDNVYTCADPAGGNDYTSNFRATSAASAIVAGAALSVQGMVEATLGWRLGARQMRAVLSDPANGTPSAPAGDLIGVMPDLKKIAGALGLLPDLYLRDFVGDGGAPHAGAISMSPDIIVRPVAVANPQAAFGTGSGTESSDTLGFTATAGQNNFVYARVRNRGAAATNVTVTVYWAPAASLVTPNLWTKIGDVVIANVPTGVTLLTVSNAIPWPAAAVPPAGHYCFVGVVGNALDPAPSPAALFDWTTYQQFIRQNNNITWRNFNVV